MTNKLKSLIYLSCFIFASIIYSITLEEHTSEYFKQIELTNSTIAVHTNAEEVQHNSKK